MYELMQLSIDNILPTAYILIVIALMGIVWNFSKKFATLESDAKVGKEQHDKDIKDLKSENQGLKDERNKLVLEYSGRIQEIEKALLSRITEAKVERKDEIQDARNESQKDIEVVQGQIDGMKSDIKDVSTRITQVNTKVEYMEIQIDDANRCIRRAEDRQYAELDYQRRKKNDLNTSHTK